ncbi:RimK/LysX family protein [Candidatus Woesearchaeota archaeon]|nr:RimK/LysX family protein [Candidatus Woesearchaeota archaeon]
MTDKIVLGLSEKVIVYGNGKSKNAVARIDTGATKSSIDVSIASELKLGPIVKTSRVRSASGNGVRPVIKARIRIKNKTFTGMFTLASREHMNYKILIGRNILKKGDFLIDPKK